MGKVVSKILTVVAVVASIAAAIPTFGASIGISAALLSGIAVAASLGASLLAPKPKAPSTSSATVSRLTVSIDTRTPRKIWFGHTAGNADLRDEEYSADQAYLDRFVVTASHKITAYEAIYFDDKLAWTAAGGVQGEYVGYLTVTPILEGSAANAINISARMGSSRRYTGCAYVRFRYKLTGNSKNTDSPFVQSIPTRVTIVGKGAPTYDPRKDTTVGGSGSHRADDQTTWEWDDNASRNPVIQELWYELGWRIQNPSTGAWKLAVGKGIPPARLNLASYIDAANLCDESVAMAAGGTEPRYRSDGVFSEGDDPSLVRDSLKTACNGLLDDVDGRIRFTVLHNDLASPIGDIGTADVIGDFTWSQTPPLDQSVNVIRGGFTDPSTESLYQLTDYPEVAFPSPDGIDRPQTVNLATVQSPSQAQRLIKLRLQRAVFGGTFEAVFQATAWRFQKGDVIRFTFAPLGWVNKLFRIADITVQVDGTVPMVLREEDASMYVWDVSDAPAVVGVSATTYDPRLGALIGAIDDAAAGGSGIVALLTNESHTLTAAADGTVGSYTGATGNFQIFSGLTDVSSNFNLSTLSGGNPQGLSVSYTGQTYTVTGGFDAGEDNASLTIQADGTGPYAGITIEKVFSLSKSVAGSSGSSPPLITLSATSQQVKFDMAGNFVAGQTITLTTVRQNSTATPTFTVYDSTGSGLTSGSAATIAAAIPAYFTTTGIDNLTMTAAFLSGYNTISIVADIGTPRDRVSIVKVQDGASGADGAGTFTLLPTASVILTPNSVQKSGSSFNWDGAAYSKETVVGDVQTQARVPSGTSAIIFGLSDAGPASSGYTDILYAIYLASTGFAYADFNSSSTAYPIAYAAGDSLLVRRRGTTVEFWKVGQSAPWYVRTGISAATPLGFDCSIYQPSYILDQITFSPVGKDGANGISALTGIVSPASITVPCTAAGTPKGTIPSAAYSATQAGADVTASLSYGTVTSSGVSGVSVSGGVISITGMSANTGSVSVPISYGGATDLLTATWTKALDGAAFVTGSATIPGIPTTSYAEVAYVDLLMGPNGSVAFDLNGMFSQSGGGSANMQGYVEYSLNGGSTYSASGVGTFTGNASNTSTSGDYAQSGSISGSSMGLTTKQTVRVHLMMRKTGSATIASGGGTLSVNWTG